MKAYTQSDEITVVNRDDGGVSLAAHMGGGTWTVLTFTVGGDVYADLHESVRVVEEAK